jgi:hypothetical protein
VVGTAVDDEAGIAELVGQRSRLAVRQGEEDDVVALQHLGRGLLEHHPPVGAQVTVHGSQLLARVGVRGDGSHLEIRMRAEQTQHLTAGVSAGSRNRD